MDLKRTHPHNAPFIVSGKRPWKKAATGVVICHSWPLPESYPLERQPGIFSFTTT
jgi:hypothetical protein